MELFSDNVLAVSETIGIIASVVVIAGIAIGVGLIIAIFRISSNTSIINDRLDNVEKINRELLRLNDIQSEQNKELIRLIGIQNELLALEIKEQRVIHGYPSDHRLDQ